MSEESPKDTQLAFTKCTICMLVDMQAILPASMNWGVNPDSKLKENQWIVNASLKGAQEWNNFTM